MSKLRYIDQQQLHTQWQQQSNLLLLFAQENLYDATPDWLYTLDPVLSRYLQIKHTCGFRPGELCIEPVEQNYIVYLSTVEYQITWLYTGLNNLRQLLSNLQLRQVIVSKEQISTAHLDLPYLLALLVTKLPDLENVQLVV